jgi:hypothetical protein
MLNDADADVIVNVFYSEFSYKDNRSVSFTHIKGAMISSLYTPVRACRDFIVGFFVAWLKSEHSGSIVAPVFTT